jgi:hypothetical protein
MVAWAVSDFSGEGGGTPTEWEVSYIHRSAPHYVEAKGEKTEGRSRHAEQHSTPRPEAERDVEALQLNGDEAVALQLNGDEAVALQQKFHHHMVEGERLFGSEDLAGAEAAFSAALKIADQVSSSTSTDMHHVSSSSTSTDMHHVSAQTNDGAPALGVVSHASLARKKLQQAKPLLLHNIGLCLSHQGAERAEEAVGVLEKAVALSPALAELRFSLGNTLLQYAQRSVLTPCSHGFISWHSLSELIYSA